MVIDDEIFTKYISHAIKVGLITLENTPTYYKIVNSPAASDFIYDNGCASTHFSFLKEVLKKPELTKCPECGHYNENIECPIILCEYCSHEFRIETKSSLSMCEDCIAQKTENCKQIPTK